MATGDDLFRRLLQYGSACLLLGKQLPHDPIDRHIALQFIRSATSAGANYEEARAAESRADFIHKLGLVLKELKESRYWLYLRESPSWWIQSKLIRLSGNAKNYARLLGAAPLQPRRRPG